MLYTSYFAKLKTLPKEVVPISICGRAPDWYNCLQYKKLAPKYTFFMQWKQNHDNDYYIKCFNEQVLNSLDPNEVYNQLINLTGTENIALICYEKLTDFCHRHLVADWFNKNGIQYIEFKK